MSFLSDYFGIVDGATEQSVCCPFDHHTSSGIPYKETNPSAHVNTLESVFHCKACGTGLSETQFIQKVLGCSYIEASKIKRIFQNDEDETQWDTLAISKETNDRALSLGISQEVINELKLKTPTGATDTIAFPVLLNGHIMDIRIYDPGRKPKIKSRINSTTGFIIPYDTWRETPSNRITLICAGEKDMAIARTHGFNAITITGGEKRLPITPLAFTNRPVAIVYDNDEAGIEGAKQLASYLLDYTPNVKVVTGFHEICTEKGEDITDFFTKYNKTKDDLIKYIKDTPIFIPSEEDKKKKYPVVDLLTASKPDKVGKMLRTNIQVVAVADTTFIAPSAILLEKFKTSGDKDTLVGGESREWELCEDNAQDILHLIDNNFKEDAITENIKKLAKIPAKERCIKIKQCAKTTVFKAYVTDMFETNQADAQPMEFIAYSLGTKLESGKKYQVTYKLTPHPYAGQKLVMIITDVSKADDSVSNFKLIDDRKEELRTIRELPGSVEERIDLLTEKVKGILGYNGNNLLIQTIDLAYNTVLQFHFGSFKNVRGYLDTIIVGESRVGKSSTAEALRNTYGLGAFASLAGNSATIPGLIGGSNKTTSGFQTRAGIIPQNHRGLIIFEEFGKSNANVIKELTDVRSSNEVRITRVSGTIALPALVRMISLTNVKSDSGVIKSIASYPNGLSIITELVDTAEDIARYDLILVLSDRGNSQIDPFWEPQAPLPPEVYQTRVRWIWSRTPEQIIIDKEVGLYVIQKSNELNEKYGCHIKIFGTETWKKLTRLSLAVAGYLVSTDDSYENIILLKEHVDFAYNFLIKIYDNPTFKLKEYVEHEKKFSTTDADAVACLQDLYTKYPGLILQLEQESATNKNVLGASAGLSNDDLNKALNRLTKALFIRYSNHEIIPTERFRLTLAEINREIFAERLGEDNA